MTAKLKSRRGLSVSKVIIYLFLMLSALVVILPLLTVFFGSFKTSQEFSQSGPLAPPGSFFNLSNFWEVLTNGKMLLAFGNTVFQLAFIAIGTVLIGTMSSYVLHRFRFHCKGLVMGAFLLVTLIPPNITNVATFQIVQALGLYNTRWAGIVLGAGTDIISIYIYLQFLDNISVSLDESATLDGASYFRIFRSIVLPLLRPATVTVLIIKCVNVYNDFYTPFLYMPNPKLAVISTMLFKFKGPYGTKWEVICAGVLLTMLPMLIIFLALQKQIYNGLVQGSVKQ